MYLVCMCILNCVMYFMHINVSGRLVLLFNKLIKSDNFVQFRHVSSKMNIFARRVVFRHFVSLYQNGNQSEPSYGIMSPFCV